MTDVKFQQVPLAALYLDNKNPRHDPIDNEPEIIASLVRTERVAALARNIAAQGLSPLERVAVIHHPLLDGRYVVVEGNRRVCALKLLRNPEKAPSSATKKLFAGLASDAAIPAKIDVAVFGDAASARHWMSVRHEGELGGVGTRKWNAAQKARFNSQGSSQSNPNSQALQLLDYAEQRGLISTEQRSDIRLTTLTRYLSNPVVRNAIGLASPKALTINAPQAEFDVAAQAFLLDAIPGDAARVHSRSKKTERETYANELRSRGVTPKTRLATAVEPVAKAKNRARNNPSPDSRACIVPADFRFNIKSKTLKRLFDELRTIDPEQFSFAAAYLFRAFIEKLAHEYAKDYGLGKEGDLHVVIGRCEQHLAQDAIRIASIGKAPHVKSLKPLREMANNSESRLSPDSLGAWVHGSMVPTGAELKRRWDSVEPCLRMMLERLK